MRASVSVSELSRLKNGRMLYEGGSESEQKMPISSHVMLSYSKALRFFSGFVLCHGTVTSEEATTL